MAPVNMYIDKFKGEVLIDEDHPLAVAQRAKGARSEPTTISGKTAAELSKLNKTQVLELVQEVTEQHPTFTVVRADGDTTKEPTKDDYIAALSRIVD